ncbi:hypothetical protein DVG80_21240 [Rhodococcus erythropolis]|nr:hypothetical protein DVG80_21240 [Rhodococcus erythropolis]
MPPIDVVRSMLEGQPNGQAGAYEQPTGGTRHERSSLGPVVAPVAGTLPRQDVREQIARELAMEPALHGFLRGADARLVALTDRLTVEVAIRAAGNARISRATAIDVPHVQDAYEYVVGNKAAQMKSVWMAIAGLLLGAAMASGVAVGLMESGPSFEPAWWAGVLVTGAVGLFFGRKGWPDPVTK